MRTRLNIVPFLFFLGSATCATAQTASDTTVFNPAAAKDSTKSHYKVEIESSFPGGMPGWAKFLGETLNYPKKAVKKKIEGVVILKFIVEKDGSVSHIEVISGDPILAGEAVRVVSQSPRWKPATGDGKPLRSYKQQPISFKLPTS